MLKLLGNFFNMDRGNGGNEKVPLLQRIVDSSMRQRPQTPDLIKDLTRGSRNFDRSSSASSVSDGIEDVFAQVHDGGSSFRTYPKLRKQKLTKRDHDKLTFQKFTCVFRKAMNGLRKESQTDKEMLNENIDDIVKILQSEPVDRPLPEEIRERAERILKDEEYVNSSPSLSFRNVDYEHAAAPAVSETDYDVLSGVWKMLATNCERGKFAITYPNYDAFADRHWLQTQPLPWQVMDESRAKCERWLNEQCE